VGKACVVDVLFDAIKVTRLATYTYQFLKLNTFYAMFNSFYNFLFIIKFNSFRKF